MSTLPDGAWAWIVVNISGGKDSQTVLKEVIHRANLSGFPKDRIVASHQCLGRMEWPGTLDLVRQHADHYGIRLEVTKYQDVRGQNLTLLDYVRKRGKWPSSQQRYCTSEFKRAPGGRVLTQLSRERPGNILHVFGFRAEESASRRKRQVLVSQPRFATRAREVWEWLPIHTWTEKRVWEDIRASGVPWHPAYDLGMPRLSCCFCIFAPRAALIVAGKANRELLDEYCDVEQEIGHTFQNGRSLSEVREAILAGEVPGEMDGNWNM